MDLPDTMDLNTSDSDSVASPPDSTDAPTQACKRKASEAGLKPNGTRPHKSSKRRASKACQCCRARKVRCNVVEHGAPCTNCRLDEVDCIVSESKRKKKWTTNEIASKQDSNNGMKPSFPTSAHAPYAPLKRTSEHVPHALYQDLNKEVNLANAQRRHTLYSPNTLFDLQQFTQKHAPLTEPFPLMTDLMSPTTSASSLPLYIKPLPHKLDADDIMYLERKGALAIPDVTLRDQLLRQYAEYVQPYMPLLNLHELVEAVDKNDGTASISLLLFQAVMFTGVATVDLRYLRSAGYSTRREARRAFFQKARLLYDFDIEADRIPLIQSLLLMTYWYETPDDQKDSHHWMGIAVSLAQTIGMHRNPERSSSIEKPRQRLWKRIWWCTYMRDRLISLGMRRPTKIKNSDYDVSMLTLEDFEIAVLPEGPSCIPAACTHMRDVEKQRRAAVLCIEKAKLCICVSNVLSVQYSVLHNNHGATSAEGSTKTTTMLGAKKLMPGEDHVQACDKELQEWKENLPEEAHRIEPTWQHVGSGNENMVLNLSLLHMIYYATLSALHRPRVLPSSAGPARNNQPDAMDISRKAVRLAASEITAIANTLYKLNLVRYLPTTGVTVLLPAIIIHLLDIKATDDATRRTSLTGFCQCMHIMAQLRDIYAAADYSTAFLEAAIRKAEITIPQKADEVKEPRNIITSSQGLIDAGMRMNLTPLATGLESLTPPPDDPTITAADMDDTLTDDDIAHKLHTFLSSTPPRSDHRSGSGSEPGVGGSGFDGRGLEGAIAIQHDFGEPDYDSLLNLDAAGELFSVDDGALAAMQGESSGFTMDMDWMKGIHQGDALTALG